MSEIRTIFIYLYRYLGEPRYVGQTTDLERRDECHSRGQYSFDKFMLQVGRNKFSFETVGQIEDFPRGYKACALENEMMDKFGTYRPGEFGYNQIRSVIKGNPSEIFDAVQGAAKAALGRPEIRQKISDGVLRKFENDLDWAARRRESQIAYAKSPEGLRQRRMALDKGREIISNSPEILERRSQSISASLKSSEKFQKAVRVAAQRPERRARLSAALKGVKKSEEHKNKLRAIGISQQCRQASIDACKGKPLTPEHRAKVGRPGVPKSEETKRRMKEASHNRLHVNGTWNPKCKLCFEVL